MSLEQRDGLQAAEVKKGQRITVLKSKIHRAIITESNLDYVGSLTVSADLMSEANLFPYEKVSVVNINNGARFETYLIEGELATGEICLNGACARLGEIGDKVIIMSFIEIAIDTAEEYMPVSLIVDDQNNIVNSSNQIVRATKFGSLLS